MMKSYFPMIAVLITAFLMALSVSPGFVRVAGEPAKKPEEAAQKAEPGAEG